MCQAFERRTAKCACGKPLRKWQEPRVAKAKLSATASRYACATMGKRLGMTHSFISKYELGERRVDFVELRQLAQIYNKDPSYLCDSIRGHSDSRFSTGGANNPAETKWAPVTDAWKSPAVADISRARSATFSDIPILIGALHAKLVGICMYATFGLK